MDLASYSYDCIAVVKSNCPVYETISNLLPCYLVCSTPTPLQLELMHLCYQPQMDTTVKFVVTTR